MLKFESTDIAFIKKYFKNSDEILNSDDLRFVLITIDDFINKDGFDDYYPNALGEAAQKVYDNIYYNNKTFND